MCERLELVRSYMEHADRTREIAALMPAGPERDALKDVADSWTHMAAQVLRPLLEKQGARFE